MSFFQHNQKALSLSFFALSRLLETVNVDAKYEVFMAENDVSTLNMLEKQRSLALYQDKPLDAIQDALQRFEAYNNHPYLYFFGVGNGVLLKKLLENPKHKRIVVVEPVLEILYVVLHLIDFAKEIESGRIVFLSKEELSFSRIALLFNNLETQRYARVYDLHVNTPFYEQFHDLMVQTNRLFIEALYHNVQSAGNDMHDALIGMEHHFMNLPFMLTTPPLFDFFKKAQTSHVAILVSTGPSLAKQLPLLKTISPYVTIFAVDASFPVLTRYSIKPDVVVSMERVPLTGRFFKDTPKEAFEGVVFALSSLQHPEVVQNIKGGITQMSMRPFGYMMATDAPQWGYVGIGMSAANMAYELIYHSGFKTCVLIGQDLAYGEDGKSHSSGHIFGEDEVKHKESDTWVERYGGNGQVKTIWAWDMFRKFFEKDIAETKAKMQTINATEGGARIAGAIELSFIEAIDKYVDKKVCKQMIELMPLSVRESKIAEKKVAVAIKEMEDYIAKQRVNVESLFLKVADICEKIDKNKEVSLDKLHNLEKEILEFRTITKEELFQKLIWHIAQSILLVQEMELAKIEVEVVHHEEEEYRKSLQWIQANRAWFFALAGCIDAIQTAMKRRGSHYTSDAEGNG